MRYFSMFTGIGGFELAIHSTWPKAQCVGFSEIDNDAIDVYKKHYPNHKNYGDATAIDPGRLPSFNLLVAGFPCQAFSIAGRRGGFDDTRGTLFFSIARIIKERRPGLVLLENVKGLLSHDQGRTIRTILATLDELDYDTETMVLDGKYFHAGQRPRVFIVASHRQPTADHGQGHKQTAPLYPDIWERARNTDIPSPEVSRGAGRIIRTLANLPGGLDDWEAFYGPQTAGGQRGTAKRSKIDTRSA